MSARGFHILIVLVFLGALCAPRAAAAAPVTYYVSSSGGSDGNNGLSSAAPFASIGKVNALNLQPGDRVLFKCGDTWHAEQLVVSHSGTPAAPIQFSSYPAGCANKPILSGSRAVSGWILDAGSVYRADLPPAAFPNGINQLFRAGQRLTLGRWPNIDAPAAGYSFVDAHSAGSSTFSDNELPAVNWAGAIVHLKNIRWSMIDRQVSASSGHTLTLNAGISCLISSWADCKDWGYFINNSRATLDQDGEWFYDSAARRVYLFSSSGLPANIEGSVILETGDTLRHGGVMLSDGSATAYVVLDNLAVINWFNHGIGSPGGMNNDIYHHITVNNVTIKDVDGAGVNLSSWLQNPPDGVQGLRGGHHMLFTNNVIDGANAFGITGYFAESTFEHNTIQNIALIRNLGKSGMSCGLTTGECTENGDGFRIRTHMAANSGFGNLLRYNYFDLIGYNAVDVFGRETTLEKNLISGACWSKADCGAVRTFGDASLASTPVYNIHLIQNLIINIPGNVDGCHPSREAMGMGLYIDNYSRDVETRDNTIIDTTAAGILYQQSSGVASGNTVFNASAGTAYSAQIDLGGSATRVTLNGNHLYGLKPNAWSLYVSSLSSLQASDQNDIFQPYVNKHIAYGPGWTTTTFAGWKALSGMDANSRTNWFTQPVGETSRGKIYYAKEQEMTFDLGNRQYLDLAQNPVVGSLTLQPYTSMILVDNGPAQLTLQGISPALSTPAGAQDFDLTLFGSGFTPTSVARWNGADRPTIFISSTRLSAAISAADVGALGSYPVTVRDNASAGAVTPPVMFHVVEAVFETYLPQAAR